MESENEDIDIQDLDITDESSTPSLPQSPRHSMSGLSLVFRANASGSKNWQAAAGPLMEETTARTIGQDSSKEGTAPTSFRASKHPKRKSDEASGAGSPSVSSVQMSQHGRSLSSTSNSSDAGRERSLSYSSGEERWSNSFSPSQRPIYVPGTSPLGASPSFDSYLSRRRSLGNQTSRSPYSPSSSPTYASLAAYHGRAATAPSSIGGHSPAFGASSPPNLPLHAHLHQGHTASTEEVIAHLSHSPHAHAELSPCPPPDADEPWIDLPPALDIAALSPSREHAPMQWGNSKSPVVIPADVNLERRRSDPSGLTRSPAARATRKANSSPARVPIRVSQAHTGQQLPILDESHRRSSPVIGSHQRVGSDPAHAAFRSPQRRPLQMEQSPSGLSSRRQVPMDLDISLALSRQRSQSPSRSRGVLSVSPVQIAGNDRRASTSSSSPSDTVAAHISTISQPQLSTSPQYSPSQVHDLAQSPIEMDLSTEEQTSSPNEHDVSTQTLPNFLKPDAKLFPPAPNHDLSLPPRSGWDLSDDADVSPLEEKSLEEAQESFDMEHDSSQEQDQDSAELRPDRSPSSPTIGMIPLPRMEAGDSESSPEWGAPLDFNRGPVVELETLSPEDPFDGDLEGDDGFHIDMDEEGLTPLERIFLFAKSEHADHRETVSRMLPVWLETVEVCEAVDYILPLFTGLIQDEDSVKEAFAASLDKLMWFFFSHCPLVELSAQHEIIKLSKDAEHEDRMDGQLRTAYKEGLSPNIAVSASGLQLYKPISADIDRGDMDDARQAFQSGKAHTTGDTPVSGSTLVEPDSGTTMLDEQHDNGVEVIDRPLLPLDTFHSILATLLMNEVSTVSAVAQEALVRFVQQLQDDKVSVPDSPGVGASIETPRPDVEGKKPHTHRHYDMPERARELLRDDIVNEIVLALFHMDERPAAFASLWKNQSSPSRDATGHQEDTSSKFSHFFDDPMVSTSLNSADEPDVQQGVFVGLTLAAMLAEASCLPSKYVEEKLLSPVVRCASDSLIVLKKQAAEVFPSFSRAISEEAVTNFLAPLLMSLSEDPSPTIRRTIANVFPEVIKKIIPEAKRRTYAIDLSDILALDDVPMVRQAYLEIAGPLIYLFEGNVPEELVAHFVGSGHASTSSDAAEDRSNDVFTPLIPAFAVAPAPEPVSHANNDGLDWDVRDDHGRAIITAYNLPGVVLSVGEPGWQKLRKLHAALALDSTVSQPRYLIASSIHDVASFIGREQAAEDLVPIYRRLAVDDDIEVVMRTFERFAELLASLPSSSTQDMVQVLLEAWLDKGREDWRLREVLAEGLVAVATRLPDASRLDGLIVALKEALYDRFTAVRLWAAKSVPHFLRNVQKLEFYYNEISTILYSLATQGHHKHRATYCLCLLEVVDAGAKIPAEHWDELANLAEDHIVDVRLVAARCLAKVFATQQESTEAPPASIVRAARALKIDPSACVREELRNVNFSGVTTSLQSHVSASYEQSSDSSDDEDNTSPTSRNRASDTGKADLLAPSDRARSEEQANNQHTNGTFVHDSAITSDRMDNTAVTVQSNDREELEESEDEDDDYDNDNDSIDLDSSTIYDIDLGDLSASSTNLSTNSTIKPIVSSSHSSSNSRETPPLLPAGNGVLTPSRLAGTPAIRPCQIQRAGSASSWHFSMREEGQFVAIDIEGHA